LTDFLADLADSGSDEMVGFARRNNDIDSNTIKRKTLPACSASVCCSASSCTACTFDGNKYYCALTLAFGASGGGGGLTLLRNFPHGGGAGYYYGLYRGVDCTGVVSALFYSTCPAPITKTTIKTTTVTATTLPSCADICCHSPGYSGACHACTDGSDSAFCNGNTGYGAIGSNYAVGNACGGGTNGHFVNC
jgi:hypothetical protein